MKREFTEPEIEVVAFVTEQTMLLLSAQVDEDGNIVTPGYGI